MAAYYNEHDKNAAAWLRELIKAGLIAQGEVDERSIEDVLPNELDGFTQCHFFAGIGVWSYALRCAGWPDDRPVWTGSCPCQPFSTAGKGGGTDDKRHLWPSFFWLIKQCQPSVIFGEQVASKDGLAWLDIVASDCDSAGYDIAHFDLPASAVGAPHIRQRLYFVAEKCGTLCYNSADVPHNTKGTDANEAMQEMWSGEAIDGVLRGKKIGRQTSLFLQGLRHTEAEGLLGEPARPEEKPKKMASKQNPYGQGLWPEVQIEASGERLNSTRQTESGQEEPSVRSASSRQGNSIPDRSRILRTDRDSVQSRIRSHIRQSFIGSNRPFGGLYLLKPARGLSFNELRAWRLGGSDAGESCQSLEETQEVASEKKSTRANSGISDESNESDNRVHAIQAHLEDEANASGQIPADDQGFGAPHIRQRLFFVADASGERIRTERSRGVEYQAAAMQGTNGQRERLWLDAGEHGTVSQLADANCSGRARQGQAQPEERRGDLVSIGRSATDKLGNTNAVGHLRSTRAGWQAKYRIEQPSGANGFWADAEWLHCRDGKYRAVEPGTFPLVDGTPARVGRLRGYGNAIVAPVAEEFIRAYLTAEDE